MRIPRIGNNRTVLGIGLLIVSALALGLGVWTDQMEQTLPVATAALASFGTLVGVSATKD